MKKHFSLILCLSALALLLVGCDRNEKQARKVGYNYAYAMANYQVDKAAEYATEETKNTTLIMAKHLTKAVGEEYIKTGRIKVDKTLNTKKYTIHDPCNIVRNGGLKMSSFPR